MKYGLAIFNRFEQTEKKRGDKIIFKKVWNIQKGIGNEPLLWDDEQAAHNHANEQVWEYKVLEYEDGQLTKPIEEYKIFKPDSK